jgi:hypothetical protein
VKVRNWWSVGAELQADWRIDEAKGWPYAMIFREHLPSWGHLLDTSMAYSMEKWFLQIKKINSIIKRNIPLIFFYWRFKLINQE